MNNRIIIVIAPKGSGKTYKVAQMVSQSERVAVFDLVRESAYSICTPYVGKPREFAANIHPSVKAFRCAYRPIDIQMDKDLVKVPELEPFIKLCFLRGDMTMVIDEAHLICSGRNCPRSLLVSSLVGRHRNLNIVVVAQRFTGVHGSLRANADEFWFWKIIEPADVDGIAERCGVDTANKVFELKPLERDEADNFVSPGEMLVWTKSKGATVNGKRSTDNGNE
jgi:hypothetical protein